MACDARQPVSGSPLAPAQGLELSARPPRQGQVDAGGALGSDGKNCIFGFNCSL